MNKKQIRKSIVYLFVTAFTLSTLFAANTNTSFAYEEFLVGEDESSNSTNTPTEDYTPSSHYTKSQSSSSSQYAECYSPYGNNVNSCNSGDLADSNYLGYNILTQ